jgi:hypothetical protein
MADQTTDTAKLYITEMVVITLTYHGIQLLTMFKARACSRGEMLDVVRLGSVLYCVSCMMLFTRKLSLMTIPLSVEGSWKKWTFLLYPTA